MANNCAGEIEFAEPRQPQWKDEVLGVGVYEFVFYSISCRSKAMLPWRIRAI